LQSLDFAKHSRLLNIEYRLVWQIAAESSLRCCLVLTSCYVLLKVLEAKPQLASYSAFTTGFNCLHYAAGMLMLLLNFMLNCNSFVMST